MEVPPYSDIPNTLSSLRAAINEKGLMPRLMLALIYAAFAGLPLPTDNALKSFPEEVRKIFQKLLRPTASQTLEVVELLYTVVANDPKDAQDKSTRTSLSKCADLLENLDMRCRIGTMLIEFYRVHNISKIDSIGSLLDQFEGVS
eukprot:757403-Hanusia_phi.AAC.3